MIQPSSASGINAKPSAAQPPAAARPPAVQAVSPTAPVMAADGVQTPAPGPAPLGTPPVAGKLELKLSDRDGFLVRGAGDIKATLTGEVTVQPDFILKQMGGLKLGDDIKLKPPRFDAERRQFVLKGKAIDKILGVLDVGFEVRLGTDKGRLAFRVDNAVKRGILYKVLGKELAKLGIETEKRDGQLFIKPAYAKAIDLPLGKGDKARIDRLETSPEQLSFSIDAQGQLVISLKDAGVNLSSDAAAKPGVAAAAPDQARLELELSLDASLSPTITLRDGELQAAAGANALAPLVKGPVAAQIREQLGSQVQVKAEQLQGEVRLKDGLGLDASADLEIKGEAGAGLSAHVEADKSAAGFSVQAQGLKAKTLGGQQLSAGAVSYAGGKLEARDLDGQLSAQGAQLRVKDLDASLGKDAQGQTTIQAEGQIEGHLEREGVIADFSSSGKQSVTLGAEGIEIRLDQADVSGKYVAKDEKTAPKAEAKAGKKPAKALDIEVTKLSGRGSAELGDMAVSGELAPGALRVRTGTRTGTVIESESALKASAKGERISGEVTAKGANVTLGAGGVQASLTDHRSKGSFRNRARLKVEGELSGDLDFKSRGGKVEVETSNGTFDARFASGEKIKVAGKGGDARFELAKGEDVKVHVEDMDMQTTINAGNTKVQARTKGQTADVSVTGPEIQISTQGAKSDLSVGVKQNVKAGGRVGDVALKIVEGERDDIDIKAKGGDVTARIGNAKQTLDIQAAVKADLGVRIQGDDVTVSSSKGETDVRMKLKDKVAVGADGKDFKVEVKGEDIEVGLEQARFDGTVTPNRKIRVEARAQQAGKLSVKVDEQEKGTVIDVKTSAPVGGHVNIDGKLDSDFSNPNGFKLHVDDGESELIAADLEKLRLNGNVTTPGVKAGVGGEGDFALRIRDGDQVGITYDGGLAGKASASKAADGDYAINGRVEVRINEKDVDVEVRGAIDAGTSKTKFGPQGKVKIDALQQPVTVSVRGGDVGFELPAGAGIELSQLQALRLGEDPKLKNLLAKLESEKIALKAENVRAAGKDISLDLRSEGIEVEYGKIDLSLGISKAGDQTEIRGGELKLTPDMDFYELLRGELSKKYKINIQGKPSFENGQIHFEGEIRTRSGITQLARFELSTRVQDNKLVFDIEKAKVLSVIGTNTVGKVLNYVLSKTDIDFFRRDKSSLELSLADVAKDLSLTQGVNFTDLKLVENRFEIGFAFTSRDQQVARLSKGQPAALKAYLDKTDLASLSGESISTAFNAFVQHEDIAAAAELMAKAARTWAVNPGSQREMGRALDWMARSQSAHKRDKEDDIGLAFAKAIRLDSPEGQKVIKALPKDLIATLADNLDRTLSQGGGFSLITAEERATANQLRRLVGLKENTRSI